MKQTIILAFALALLRAGPATADPLTFGQSWDGNPPGTLATITGLTGFQTASSFGAGTYTIDIDGGYTAWFDKDIVGAGDTTLCNGTCTQASTHTVTMDQTWNLWATTPSYTDGEQFAIVQTSADTWTWGLEDILLSQSDADFQDVFGTLTRIPKPSNDSPIERYYSTPAPTPVPEPSMCLLTGLLLLAVAWRYRMA